MSRISDHPKSQLAATVVCDGSGLRRGVHRDDGGS
jgi:hypothetical protein